MAPSSLLSAGTVAVVTGANRGIGTEIVRLIAEQGPTVVLTARDEAKGKAAADALVAKGLKNVVFHQLDPVDSKSVEKLAAWLKSTYGGLDILINNAATQPPSYDYESAKAVLEVNYFSVKNLTAALLPLLKASPHGARIINISSRAALYNRLTSDELKKPFQDEDNYTEELADSLATNFVNAMKDGTAQKDGYIPNALGKVPIYTESKMFLNIYSVSLAKSLANSQPKDHQIFVASMCPGVTRTEMMLLAEKSGWVTPEGYPVKTPGEGADTAVWLALLPESEWPGKEGKFFGERTEFLIGGKPSF